MTEWGRRATARRPLPLHSVYGEFRASIEIETERVHGHLPPRVLALILEWARLRRAEILEDWRRARAGESLIRIAPLE
ncbi:MAG: DUF4160 domain-containing protein [Gemmatimonadota bacterium]|nr:DUF4160 domain-containing protein [Gemmatimonadota bacterium]